jgi:hypothetical protein
MLCLRKQMNEFVRIWTGAGSIEIVCLKAQRMISISRWPGCLHCNCVMFLNKLLQLSNLSTSSVTHFITIIIIVSIMLLLSSLLSLLSSYFICFLRFWLWLLLLVWVDNHKDFELHSAATPGLLLTVKEFVLKLVQWWYHHLWPFLQMLFKLHHTL